MSSASDHTHFPGKPRALPVLPAGVVPAVRFWTGHKLMLATPDGSCYEGTDVGPARWPHLPVGTKLFVRPNTGAHVEAENIVQAVVLANDLGTWPTPAEGQTLTLDLAPPHGEAVGGAVVAWDWSQIRTLFLYWDRTGRRK